jgi:hypothetical protein
VNHHPHITLDVQVLSDYPTNSSELLTMIRVLKIDIMTAFWDIPPRSLVEETDVSELRTVSISRAIEAVRTSETSAYFNEVTWRYIPESCHLHTRDRENLKYHKVDTVDEIL